MNKANLTLTNPAEMEGWQSTPVVNIFKLCDAENKKDVELSGKVGLRMDEVIHKKVFRIVGSIPAVNFIKLPKHKPLGLGGRFLYLQVKFEPGAPLFSVHVELLTADGNTRRVSVGNIFKQENLKKKAGCVQLSLPDPPEGWTLLSLDLQAAVASGGGGVGSLSSSSSPSPFKALKSVQLCSTITVRGAFSSDVRFGLQTLPREMLLSHSLDPSKLRQVWSPAEPTDVPEPVNINKPILPKKKPSVPSSRRTGTASTVVADTAAAGAGGGGGSDQTQHHGDDVSDALPAAAAGATAAAGSTAAVTPSAVARRRRSGTGGTAAAAGVLSREVSGLSLAGEVSGVSSGSCRSAAAAVPPRLLLPDPYIKLQQVNGFTGEYCRSVLYNAATDELIFPAGSMVIALAAGNNDNSSSGHGSSGTANTAGAAAGGGGGCSSTSQQQQQQRKQRFFLGHTAFVSCLALGGQGRLLATGQEGKQPLIRLWDCSKPQQQQQQQQQQGDVGGAGGKCLAILCAHASNLAALDVSADGRALVACGADSLARQTIVLWDIRDVRATGKAQLLVKSVTSYHVRVMRFSPFEPDHFVAAGRDNIRCYRIKGDEVRGISIKLQVPTTPAGLVAGGASHSVVSGSAPKVFTDIAFEAASSGLQLATQHMYVATAGGAVFQVDYARRALTAVYQLHAAAINSIAVGEGLALTASDDTTLRLWPLDFSGHLLEAQHDAPVTSACLGSPDGLLLVAGSEDGSLGVLDVVGRAHSSLLRTHCGAVEDLAAHPNRRSEYVTTSTDGSVRIWDAATHQQLFQLTAGSTATVNGSTAAACRPSCAALNPVAAQLAVGYREGLVRLFDVASSQMLQERQQHIGRITQLLFTPDGGRLLSCGADGRVVVYAAGPHNLLPIKALTTPPPPAVGGGSSSGTPGGGRTRPASAAAAATSSSFGRASSRVCVAVSSDGRLIAVGQPSDGTASLGTDVAGGSSSSSGGCSAAVVLFNAALEAVLQIDTPGERIDRVEFSPDSSCIWALAAMPCAEDGSRSISAAAAAKLPSSSITASSASPTVSSSSSLLCFSVADGSLVQVLRQPHGNSGSSSGAAAAAVTSFCLDAAGAVLVTCGTDHLIKLWNVGGGSSSSSVAGGAVQQGQQYSGAATATAATAAAMLGVPVCQSFTAHCGAVTGAAFVNGQLLTAGADGNICVWSLTAPPPAAAAAAGGAAAAGAIAIGSSSNRPAITSSTQGGAGGALIHSQQQQPQQQQQHQNKHESPAAADLQSWLEARNSSSSSGSGSRVAGAPAGGVAAGGVPVVQQRETLVDEGLQPSPLFSEPAHQQQQQQQQRQQAQAAGSSNNNHNVSSSSIWNRRNDPLLSCSAVLGLDASRCGVLWLQHSAQLAYAAANTLILYDLATKRQSLLSHHRQDISALAVSCDGLLLATGSAAAEPAGGYADVALWDVQQRRLLMLLQQHPVCVEQLAFSPDGAWLLSVGSGRVVLWDVASGAAVAVGAVRQAVTGAAWLPRNPEPTFVTCGGDGLLLWTLTPAFLEQRQLDIPDIALAVSASSSAAAAAAGGGGGGSASAGGRTQATGCRITAVCTSASSGGWLVQDSLTAPASAAAAAAGASSSSLLDPVLQRQQREAAAVTVFAADSMGGVWQLAVGGGRLCGCVKVANLDQDSGGPGWARSGEWAAALQWSQAAAALAVGTSSGRLLRFTCSSSNSGSGGGGVGGGGSAVARRLATGVEAAVTPRQAVSQWWAAVATAGGGCGGDAPCWTEDSSSNSSRSANEKQQQQHGALQLDGAVVRLCLEPTGLSEGVVSTDPASAWFIDLLQNPSNSSNAQSRGPQKAPLLGGPGGDVTSLLPLELNVGGSGWRVEGTLVASISAQDGCLAVWQTAGGGGDVNANSTSSGSSGSSRGMSQVPLAEWRRAGGGVPVGGAAAAAAAAAGPTAAAVLPGSDGQSACVVLGHADGSIALLDMPSLLASSGGSGGSSDGGGGGGARRQNGQEQGTAAAAAGVLRWCVVRHPSAVIALAVHAQQPLVMAASRDGLITTTNTDTGSLVATCRDLTGTVAPLHAFAINTNLTSSSSTSSTAALATAAASGAGAGEGGGRCGDSISSGGTSSGGGSGSCVAAAAWLDRLLVFQAPWGDPDAAPVVCSYQCPEVPHSLPAGIQSRLSFIPGSSSLLLFTSPCLGPTALLFDFRVGQPLRELRLTGCPASLAVAPSGGMFAFGLAGRGVLLADAAAESSLELRPCGGGGGAGGSTTSSTAVQAVAFAAGGRKLLCAVGGLITVWDA